MLCVFHCCITINSPSHSFPIGKRCPHFCAPLRDKCPSRGIKTSPSITKMKSGCILQFYWIHGPQYSVCTSFGMGTDHEIWCSSSSVEMNCTHSQSPEWIRGPILLDSQPCWYFVRINSIDRKNRQKTNCVMIKVRKQDVPSSFSHPVIGELCSGKQRQRKRKEWEMFACLHFI